MSFAIARRAAIAGAAALASAGAEAAIPAADIPPPKWDIEPGASLRVLRPAKYVEADETVFRANTKRFSDATGVAVEVEFSGWEELRPMAARAANSGAGPDVVLGWGSDPHLYADRLVRVNDLADYLAAKYGGWEFLADKYGKRWKSNDWISLPMGASAEPCVYRVSWVKEAGFNVIPPDLDGFMTLCRRLKQNGHPAGFSLGNAIGDANALANWLLWSHGASFIGEEGQITINTKQTVEALKYARELYAQMPPGTLAWQDITNNKEFLAGNVGLTQNSVSIYYAAKNTPTLAEDTAHAPMPFGAANKDPLTATMLCAFIFRHSKAPNAAKTYLRFMMEAEQYDPWLTGCLGYWAQPLKAYEQSELWASDPKLAEFKKSCSHEFWEGYKGPITAAATAITGNYVNVHMFAAVASGQATPEEAIREAERQGRRYYRS